MPIVSNSFPPAPPACRPACCKSPSRVVVKEVSTLTVRFSSPVYGLNGSTFTLTDSSGNLVPGAVDGNATIRATFTPTVPLPIGTYTATLSGLRDVKGCLIADFTFTVYGSTVSPLVGSTVHSLLAANNHAVITFSTALQVVDFTLVNITNGVARTGTVAPALGSSSTSFTFTPSGPLLAGVYRATVTVVISATQTEVFTWEWTVSAT